MRHQMFGEVSNPTQRLGSQSRYTVPVSILVHVTVAAGVVIAPLMAADVLPTPRTVIGAFAAQPVPPPLPPPAAAPPAARSTKPSPAPSTAAPSTAASSIEPERPTTSVVGQPDGVKGGLPNGIVGSLGVVPYAPVVPTLEPRPPSGPVPVGGRIKEPTKIRHVPPVYPSIAQQARVEGIVIIEAVIGIDGRVKQARVLRSKPLLDDAALEAVRQWLFTPTMLNGVPVPVIMTVTVNFKLN